MKSCVCFTKMYHEISKIMVGTDLNQITGAPSKLSFYSLQASMPSVSNLIEIRFRLLERIFFKNSIFLGVGWVWIWFMHLDQMCERSTELNKIQVWGVSLVGELFIVILSILDALITRVVSFTWHMYYKYCISWNYPCLYIDLRPGRWYPSVMFINSHM